MAIPAAGAFEPHRAFARCKTAGERRKLGRPPSAHGDPACSSCLRVPRRRVRGAPEARLELQPRKRIPLCTSPCCSHTARSAPRPDSCSGACRRCTARQMCSRVSRHLALAARRAHLVAFGPCKVRWHFEHVSPSGSCPAGHTRAVVVRDSRWRAVAVALRSAAFDSVSQPRTRLAGRGAARSSAAVAAEYSVYVWCGHGVATPLLQ